MKVEGKMDVKIDIDKKEQHKITKKYLHKVFDIQEDAFVDDKHNLSYSWEESMGSHSSIEREVIRKATAQDMLFFKFMSTLDSIIEEE
jgi:hypothetical protein